MAVDPAGINKSVIDASPALKDGAVAVKAIACHIKNKKLGWWPEQYKGLHR
jgi:type IV pilus biogenesis protein CpaD/CtpE